MSLPAQYMAHLEDKHQSILEGLDTYFASNDGDYLSHIILHVAKEAFSHANIEDDCYPFEYDSYRKEIIAGIIKSAINLLIREK